MTPRRPVVLHVLEAYAGGTERHLNDLVRYATEYQHVLAVPSVHNRRSTERAATVARAAAARVVAIEMSRGRDAHRNLSALLALRALARRVQPDIVHVHSSIGGVIGRLATLSVPVPVVYTANGVSRALWAVQIERMLAGRVDRFIAVSASEAAFAIRHRLARADRLAVIPNGIELTPPESEPTCPLRDRLGISRDALVVGCIGRLTRQKAPELYVAACARVHERRPDAHFVLIGSGELQHKIEAAIDESGLAGRFHLIPYLENAARVMHELDLYVLASRFEGGPYTPLEAMRAGTPVIVTDVCGNRDSVADGASGLIVPPNRPDVLSAAMLRVLSDPELGRALAEGGLRALERFDVRTMAASTEAVYAELLDRRGPVRDLGPAIPAQR